MVSGSVSAFIQHFIQDTSVCGVVINAPASDTFISSSQVVQTLTASLKAGKTWQHFVYKESLKINAIYIVFIQL